MTIEYDNLFEVVILNEARQFENQSPKRQTNAKQNVDETDSHYNLGWELPIPNHL